MYNHSQHASAYPLVPGSPRVQAQAFPSGPPPGASASGSAGMGLVGGGGSGTGPSASSGGNPSSSSSSGGGGARGFGAKLGLNLGGGGGSGNKPRSHSVNSAASNASASSPSAGALTLNTNMLNVGGNSNSNMNSAAAAQHIPLPPSPMYPPSQLPQQLQQQQQQPQRLPGWHGAPIVPSIRSASGSGKHSTPPASPIFHHTPGGAPAFFPPTQQQQQQMQMQQQMQFQQQQMMQMQLQQQQEQQQVRMQQGGNANNNAQSVHSSHSSTSTLQPQGQGQAPPSRPPFSPQGSFNGELPPIGGPSGIGTGAGGAGYQAGPGELGDAAVGLGLGVPGSAGGPSPSSGPQGRGAPSPQGLVNGAGGGSAAGSAGPSQPLAAKGANSSTLASAVTPFPYEPSHSLQSQQQQQQYGLGFAQAQGQGAYGAPSPSPTPGAAPGYAGQPGSAALARNPTGSSTHSHTSSNAGAGAGAGTGAAYGHRPGLSAGGGSFSGSSALGVGSAMSGSGHGHANGAGASLNGRLTPGGGPIGGNNGSGGANGSSNGTGPGNSNNNNGPSPPLSRNTTLRKIREAGGRVSPYPPPPPASPGSKSAATFAGGAAGSSGFSEATGAGGFTLTSTAAAAGAGTALAGAVGMGSLPNSQASSRIGHGGMPGSVSLRRGDSNYSQGTHHSHAHTLSSSSSSHQFAVAMQQNISSNGNAAGWQGAAPSLSRSTTGNSIQAPPNAQPQLDSLAAQPPRSPGGGTFRVTNMDPPQEEVLPAASASSGSLARNGSAGSAAPFALQQAPEIAPPSSSSSDPANAANSSGTVTTGSGPSSSRDGELLQPTPSQRRRVRPDTEEIRRTGRAHYEELLRFLRSHLAKSEAGGPRSNAREKLTRLSKQQFAELSTDVYDELIRRQTNAKHGTDSPHLAVREEFHPKRNQARQKLATLPKTRFKDLGSDVFFELERRFPELKQEFRPEAAARDLKQAEAAKRAQEQEAQEREYAAAAAASQQTDAMAASTSSRSLPGAEEGRSLPSPALAGPGPQLSTDAEVLPSKSTLVEENVGIPFATADSTTALSAAPSREILRDSVLDGSRSSMLDGASARDSVNSDVQGRIGGLSGLNALTKRESGRHTGGFDTRTSLASSAGASYLNGYNHTPRVGDSHDLDASQFSEGTAGLRHQQNLQQQLVSAEEKAKELELLLAQARDQSREKDLIINELRDSHARSARELREEHDMRYEGKHQELEHTLAQLERLRADHAAFQEESLSRASIGQPQLEELQRERDALQSEYAQQEEIAQELQGQVASLMQELKELAQRNDHMMAELDSNAMVISDLNAQVQSYKRKYENAKTELRNLKATSQLYVKPPKADDYMPASDTGGIADVHLTAFQSSIDELLAAARSKTPSNVLLAMKTVVLATTLVTDDVSKAEQAGATGLNQEENEQLQSLKSRASATLNNLMTACRNHASSHGLSPVSLLDAAASHVSTTIVDLVKLLKVRKGSKVEAEQLEATFTQDGTRTLQNGLKPLHISGAARGTEPSSPTGSTHKELKPRVPSEKFATLTEQAAVSPRARSGSMFGRYSPVGYRGDALNQKDNGGEGSWKKPSSGSMRANSTSSGSSVRAASLPKMPSRSKSGRTTPDTSAATLLVAGSPASNARMSSDSGDENWAELRGYIETQTKEIVNSISALLSAIREGAQGVQLREHLTQIVTIVSSIVAITNDNIPSAARKEGDRILQALTENCDKLGEMQNYTNFDKTTKTTMASASYGVAKGLKALELLLNDADDA